MGHGAAGAQGGRRSVGVEVGLGREVGSGGQVGVHRAVARAVVREGVGSLRHGGGDVGLLAAVAPGAVRGWVLLSLREKWGTALQKQDWVGMMGMGMGLTEMGKGWPELGPEQSSQGYQTRAGMLLPLL